MNTSLEDRYKFSHDGGTVRVQAADGRTVTETSTRLAMEQVFFALTSAGMVPDDPATLWKFIKEYRSCRDVYQAVDRMREARARYLESKGPDAKWPPDARPRYGDPMDALERLIRPEEH